MADSGSNWKHLGEIAVGAAAAIAAVVGGNRVFRKPSKPEPSGEDESMVGIHLDRISRAQDELVVNVNDQNIQLLRMAADFRGIRREMIALANRVSDLESKSKGTT